MTGAGLRRNTPDSEISTQKGFTGRYNVHVISDCVTSYDLKKMDEMLAYYAAKGCEVKTLKAYKDLGVTDGED